jgi:hypothetical protein
MPKQPENQTAEQRAVMRENYKRVLVQQWNAEGSLPPLTVRRPRRTVTGHLAHSSTAWRLRCGKRSELMLVTTCSAIPPIPNQPIRLSTNQMSGPMGSIRSSSRRGCSGP